MKKFAVMALILILVGTCLTIIPQGSTQTSSDQSINIIFIAAVGLVFLVIVLSVISRNPSGQYKDSDNERITNYKEGDDFSGRVAGRHGQYHRQRARREVAIQKAMYKLTHGDPRIALAMMEGSDGKSRFDKELEARFDKELEGLGIWGEDVLQNLRDNPHYYDS